jgi:glycine cleavage system H protein
VVCLLELRRRCRLQAMLTPENLRYSSDHEWVKAEDSNRVRVGITDYAQDALGDVVFVELPEIGSAVAVGQSISEVESTKSVSDIYAPVAGTVVEVNNELTDEPEKINADPYGDGWIFVVELGADADLDSLLDAEAYSKLIEG